MIINGRQAECYYLTDARFHYLELRQKEGDCPEGKNAVERLVCPGDCQGTYLSAVVSEEEALVIGTIYPQPHVMYIEEFFRKRGFSSLEEARAVIQRSRDGGKARIEPSMGGRRKRVFIDGEHAQSIFEGCTFRQVQNDEFRTLVNRLRKDELRQILVCFEEISREAKPTDLKTLGKELFPS